MADRSVTHDTLTIERHFDAPPARVFAAWADPIRKARWFTGPDDWDLTGYALDFRVGGRERASSRPPDGGPEHVYNAQYQDIVPDQRIIFSYDMSLDDIRISVSLATVELTPVGAGTRLLYTEQGAYLDGHESPRLREQGMGDLFDALDLELHRQH